MFYTPKCVIRLSLFATGGADDIPSESVRVQQAGIPENPIVMVAWRDPQEPNGIIVTVDIELKNLDRNEVGSREGID